MSTTEITALDDLPNSLPANLPPRRRAREQGDVRRAAPTLLVALASLTFWLISGVSLTDGLLFVGYHLAYVIGPGWVAYRILRPSDPMLLRQFVLGWALGYVLEVLAFVGTAAAGERPLLTFYPLLVFALGLIAWRRRTRRREAVVTRIELPATWGWAVGGLCLLALAFLGVEYFGSAPLPNQVSRVSYGIDTVWYLSLAGAALHHWPVGDPTVSGQPLFYHLFASFDSAAITQVTGIGLPVVFFRLCMVPMVILTVVGLALAGATFGRSWTGPIAVALALFVGEINLDPHVGYKFANEMGDDVVAISPSFLFGAALFAPLLAVLGELRMVRWRHRIPKGMLVVFGLLAVGAAGAKAPTTPVLGGGLLLYLVWQLAIRRTVHRTLVAAFGLTVAVFVVFWMLAYGGAGSDQLSLQPPGAIRQMEVTGYFAGLLGAHGVWLIAAWTGLTIVGFLGAYGPQLAGVAGGGLQMPGAGLLLALFVAGQVPYLLYTHPGLSQVFFSEYGLMAACLVSAEGIRLLCARVPNKRVLATAMAGSAAAAVLAFALPSVLGLHGATGRNAYLYADGALALVLTAAGGLAIAWRRMRSVRWAYVAATALAVGATGRVLTVAAPTARLLAAGRPLYSRTGNGLTSGLYRALDWIRTHTSPTSIIAVNNFRDWSLYWTDGWAVPDDFYYSAFSQRTVFLEGWIYTQAATQAPSAVYYGRQLLFPQRVRLDNEIFQWAHADALRVAAQLYGVRYLLVDRVHNRANPRLGTIARRVFTDRDASVYAVPPTDTRLAAGSRAHVA